MAIESKGQGTDSENPPVAATISVDPIVDKISPGGTPTVTESGTPQNRVVRFGLVTGDKGEKGDDGADSTVPGPPGPPVQAVIGDVQASDDPEAYDVTVTNDPTTKTAIFNFVLARGYQGERGFRGFTGLQGIQGPPGLDSFEYWKRETGQPDTVTFEAYRAFFKGDKGDTGEQGLIGKTLTTIQTNNIATALNIGPEPGKNHWLLQLSQVKPTPSIGNPNPTIPTSFLTISQQEMVNGVTYGDAKPSTDGRSVELSTRIDAAAGTSGSSFPRAEFRELDQSGSNAAWDPAQGTHLWEGTYTILELPKDSIQQTVVLQQVHNNNNDVFVIRTQVNTDGNGVRQLRLLLRLNGSSAVANTIVQNNPIVGQAFDMRVLIQEGFLYFWHAAAGSSFGDNFNTNGPTYRTTTAFQGPGVDVKAKNLNALGYGVDANLQPYASGSTFVNGLPAWYFKFGQYTQTNPTLEATPLRAIGSNDPTPVTGNPLGYFRTRWSRVRHWHVINGTPWATPERIDYGQRPDAVQGNQGAAGQIASVVTKDLATGTPSYAKNLGTQQVAELEIGIPAGPAGRAATVAIGTITDVGPEERSDVTNGGSVNDAILNFKLRQGKTGAKGEPGLYVTAATVNSQYRLIVTLSNGDVLDAGFVRGQKGDTGDRGISVTGFSISGTNHLLVTLSNGETVDAGLLPAGPKGDQGPPGPSGIYVQQTSPGNIGRPYIWFKTDVNGKVTNRILDDGKG